MRYGVSPFNTILVVSDHFQLRKLKVHAFQTYFLERHMARIQEPHWSLIEWGDMVFIWFRSIVILAHFHCVGK
jgi:hypothetical protein